MGRKAEPRGSDFNAHLGLVSQRLAERLVFAVTQEAVRVQVVVVAVETEHHQVAGRLRAVEFGRDKADLRGGPAQI